MTSTLTSRSSSPKGMKRKMPTATTTATASSSSSVFVMAAAAATAAALCVTSSRSSSGSSSSSSMMGLPTVQGFVLPSASSSLPLPAAARFHQPRHTTSITTPSLGGRRRPAPSFLRAATEGGDEEPVPALTLREEIRETLNGLFGAFVGKEGASVDAAAAAAAAADALSKTKGGADGRPAPSSSFVTRGSPSTTTVSLLETPLDATMVASSPCDSAIAAAPSPREQKNNLAVEAAASVEQKMPPTRPLSATDAALGKVPEPVNENIARISDKVPNTWLAVCHSASLKKKELKKIWVDDKPICLFRTKSGEVKAISDICLHRAAALSDGWLEDDMVVCPYHAYKFDGEGKLRYIPGVDEALLAKNKRTARTVWYKTLEQGGLVYIFPDPLRAGAIEQHVKPFLLPEATDPTFRVVEGEAEIKAAANLVVENLLDMLHISYVHSFGNMQEPLPFSEAYDYFYDDEASQLLPYARTTFKYRAGPTSISKVVGQVKEVVVENEFHLPYTTVTRVRFGKDVKTIYVVAVPIDDNLTVVHYKLYRNFMYVHPRDESIVNKSLDQFFQSVMRLTLNEDKEILESLYQEHQAGYVLSRYDKPLKIYRKTMKEFAEATKARESIAERRTLEMELLRLIETTERGRKATRGQHSTILSIVTALEKGFARQFGGGEDGDGELIIEDAAVNGTWHLVYANPGNISSLPTATESTVKKLKEETLLSAQATRRETDDVPLNCIEGSQKLQQRLRSAGGERYLLDFQSKGRPAWTDTEQSIQTIDTANNLLSNTAVYQGLLGIKTKVELNGIFKKVAPNRKDVQFKTAQVDVGGFKVTFPHMDVFGVSGWLDTTFVDEHIRICRGNRGSVFVLTRRPLARTPANAPVV